MHFRQLNVLTAKLVYQVDYNETFVSLYDQKPKIFILAPMQQHSSCKFSKESNIQEIRTSISIEYKVDKCLTEDGESDKHLQAVDCRYSCLILPLIDQITDENVVILPLISNTCLWQIWAVLFCIVYNNILPLQSVLHHQFATEQNVKLETLISSKTISPNQK